MHGPRELLSNNITIVQNEVCGNMSNRICAGPDTVSGCAGDDGGPTVCENRLSGLIDYTDIHYCNNTVQGRHTPYINIAAYRDWITLVVGEAPAVDETPIESDGERILISCSIMLFAAFFLKLFG